ncbi:DUF6232 family protein [Sorangium sp. So ce1014]|uniref:DUF6232 family protein n=1 Tax=Sorangium sp. So ce1014 TaxID=3133326 RepID=UPI003F6012C6
MDELTLYSDGGTLVTSTRFVVGTSTYAMSQITSVTTVAIPKSTRLLIWGVVVALCGVSCVGIGASSSGGGASTLGVLQLLVGAAMVAAYVLVLKAQYAVSIGTSGGQVRALVSTDMAAVAKIAGALTQVIVMRR